MKHVGALAALLAGVALFNMANGLFGTLLALHMTDAGFSTTAVGAVLSAYFIGFIAATLTGRRLIARVGHIRAFAACAALAAVSALAHPLWVSGLFWVALRVVTGFCIAAMTMTIESWLHGTVTNEFRGRLLSIYMVVLYLAVAGSQLLIGLGTPGGYELFNVIAAMFALALVPVVLTRTQAPPIHEVKAVSFRELVRLSPLAFVAVSASGASNTAFHTVGPVFAAQSGLSVAEVGNFIGIAVFAGLVLQFPLGWLSDRTDRRRLIAAVAFGTMAASAALFVAAGAGTATLLVLSAAYGGCAFQIYAQASAHANDYAKHGNLVAVSAGLLLANGTGAIAAPLLAGAAMDAWGPRALFACLAVVMACLGVFALYRMRKREGVPVAEHAPFVAVPVTTSVVADLDPRVGG